MNVAHLHLSATPQHVPRPTAGQFRSVRHFGLGLCVSGEANEEELQGGHPFHVPRVSGKSSLQSFL